MAASDFKRKPGKPLLPPVNAQVNKGSAKKMMANNNKKKN